MEAEFHPIKFQEGELMSKKIIKLRTEDGSIIKIETTAEGLKNVSLVDDAKALLFDKIPELATKCSKGFVGYLLKVAKEFNNPDTISLEFGITVSAKEGVVIVEHATEAAFKVSMTWNAKKES